MGFDFGAFAAGFAEETADIITEKRKNVEELVKAKYVSAFEEAKKVREQNRETKKKSREAIQTLKSLGIKDETKIANLLDQNGHEGLISLSAKLQEKAFDGITIDPEAFLTNVANSELTIEDAFKRLDGDVKYIEAGVPVNADGEKSFWERVLGMDYAEGATRRVESAMGEKYSDLLSEARDERTYAEATGGIDINWDELRKANPGDGLSAGEIASLEDDFYEFLGPSFGVGRGFDEKSQMYIETEEREGAIVGARKAASDAARAIDILVRQGTPVGTARNQVLNQLIGAEQGAEESADAGTPDAEMTAEEYAQKRAKEFNIQTSNPDVLRTQISTIQSELRTKYGLGTEEINAIVEGLVGNG
jgi:hypothetical protein